MIIEEIDFKLEQVGTTELFDLSLLITVNAKNLDKKREEMKLVAYGIQFKSAIIKIINHRISRKKSILNLKEYFKLFEEQSKEVLKLCST